MNDYVVYVRSLHPLFHSNSPCVHDQGQARACCPGCQEEHHIVPALWKPTIWWGEMLQDADTHGKDQSNVHS